MKIEKFKGTSISFNNDNVFATRNQIMELYEVPAMTLSDNIKKLKDDGLIVGTEIRTDVNNRKIEVYNLDEILAIGIRLRTDKAIAFQRWAIGILKKEVLEANRKIDIQQAQLDWFWDKQDQKDLYG